MQPQLMFSSFWHEVDGFGGTPRSLDFGVTLPGKKFELESGKISTA